MITLYGASPTRATRVQWMLEELELEYDHVAQPERDAGFLALNPHGKVPVLVDGDVVVWESMAINLYLAQRQPNAFWPASLDAQARVLMWSFWAVAEVEERALIALRNRALLPEAERDPSQADAAEAELASRLAVLDATLASSPYLLGRAFSVADLNAASICVLARFARVDTGANVARWLDACFERPAAKRAR